MRKLKLGDITIESFITIINTQQSKTLEGGANKAPQYNNIDTLCEIACSRFCPTPEPGLDTKKRVDSQCYECPIDSRVATCTNCEGGITNP